MKTRSQRGYTLVEVMVGTGILGLISTLIGSGLFQTITLRGKTSETFQAAGSTRTATGWITQDIPMALTTDLVDGGAPVSSATFTWTDLFQNAQAPHSVSYALVSGNLQRNYDGTTDVIGRGITDVSFTRAGRLVTISVTSNSNGRFKVSDAKTVKAYLRSS